MVEALAFALSAYAPFGGWPWWLALIFGALAGLWTTRVRSFVSGGKGSSSWVSGSGMAIAAGGAIFGALLCLMVYFAARSIALQS